MAKTLIQVSPSKAQDIAATLEKSRLPVSYGGFDYLSADLPSGVEPQVEKLSGVVTVRPDTIVEIRQVLATPIEAKLKQFYNLFFSNPFTGPLKAFSYSSQADAGIERWVTSEARKMLGADIAEQEGYTGKGIKVAVIDTGAVPTAQGHYIDMGSRSSTEGMPLAWDENGHGTHCATILSGNPVNTPYGLLKGMAPDCETGVFKALGYLLGAGTQSSVLRAMMDAFEWGADIISMSLGSPYDLESPDTIPECRAIRMLTGAGLIVCVAVGNDGDGDRTVGVPACEPSALTVGAIDMRGDLAHFSSRGPTQEDQIKPDVVAPGVNITSSSTGLIALMQMGRDFVGTASISGSSMSTPFFAGLCVLMKGLYRENGIELTTPMIKDMMAKYGRPKDNLYGWGVPHWDYAKSYLADIRR